MCNEDKVRIDRQQELITELLFLIRDMTKSLKNISLAHGGLGEEVKDRIEHIKEEYYGSRHI